MSHTAHSPPSAAASKPECTLPSKPHSHVFRRGRMVCVPYIMKLGSLECGHEQAVRIIGARGRDVGNESMRAGGRTAWSRADYNAACREANRLFKLVGLAP